MNAEKILLNCKSQLSREAEELQKEMSTLPPGRLACYRNGRTVNLMFENTRMRRHIFQFGRNS